MPFTHAENAFSSQAKPNQGKNAKQCVMFLLRKFPLKLKRNASKKCRVASRVNVQQKGHLLKRSTNGNLFTSDKISPESYFDGVGLWWNVIQTMERRAFFLITRSESFLIRHGMKQFN